MVVRSAFQSAGPVVGEDFVGRREELAALLGALDDLKQGVRRLYCVLGPRKIGKTSLFEELTRRIAEDPDLLPCRVDLFTANTPARFFVRLSLSLLDSFMKKRYGGPLLSGLVDDETALTMAAARLEALGVRSVDRALSSTLALIRGGRGTGRHFQPLLDLPAELARESGMHPVVMLDEFQEVLRFDSFKEVRDSVGDILKLIRSRWQIHREVAYFISGSEVSLLQGIISSEGSPLFGHFIPLCLNPFSSSEALGFLEERFEQSGIEIPRAMADRLVQVTGGHAFYLQVLGEDLCLRSPARKLGERVFKETVQDALFSSTGRLQLHFAGMYERYVGRSTTLEGVLVALAAGHSSVSDIAAVTGQQTGAVSTALKQLSDKDLVSRSDEIGYFIQDPTFAIWVSGNRSALRNIAGPYHLGSEAERAVCKLLGREGFQLVYRSRGSKGAFDLLALLGATQVGLQVKRSSRSPFYLAASEHGRMVQWGRKLGWIPILAVYDPDGERCLYYDPRNSGRKTRKGFRFDESEGHVQLLDLI